MPAAKEAHRYLTALRPVPVAPTRTTDTSPASDPLVHLRALTSPAMEGRDTPSEGLNRAARYIAGVLKSHGVAPASRNSSGASYFQPFAVTAMPGRVAARPAVSSSELQALRSARRSGTAANVVGLLPGSGPNRHEVVVLMAHYDHLGTWGDKVYNGADDNGSGAAVLMATVPELVRAQKAGELDRSVLLLWTAGEEKGLLGAEAFCKHKGLPTAPLERVCAVVNIDMVGRWGADHISAWARTGGRPNRLRGLLAEANRKLDKPFRINEDLGMTSDDQDGAVFEARGFDTLFLFEGHSNPLGGGQLHADYHTEYDTVAAIMRDNGGVKLRRLAKLVQALAPGIANEKQEQPAWQPDVPLPVAA